MRKLTLGSVWTNVDYSKVNKIAVDLLLIEQFADNFIMYYAQDMAIDYEKLLTEFTKNFDRRYNDIMLYFANFPNTNKLGMSLRELRLDTLDDYSYLALLYIAAYCRENSECISKDYKEEMALNLKFDSNLEELVLSHILLSENNSFVMGQLHVQKDINVFSTNYDIKTINPPYYSQDKAAILTCLFYLSCRSVVELSFSIDDLNKSEINKLKTKLAKREESIKSLKKDFDNYKTSVSKRNNSGESEIRKLKKTIESNEKQIGELINNVMALERENALLHDKNAIYELEFSSNDEDRQAAEIIFEEEVENVNISDYKIVIITTESSSKFSLPTLDLTNQTERINALLSYELVAFDTKHNSHPCYYQTKQFCKTNGIKFIHMSCAPAGMVRDIKKYILSRSI